MIRSMTGFGRAVETLHGREITAEIKSVNHRYFELSVRLPRSLSFLEEKAKAKLQSEIDRGKVEVYLGVVSRTAQDSVIEPNIELARGYYKAVSKMAVELELKNDLTLSSLARYPDIFNVYTETPDEESLWADIESVLSKALEGYQAMRAAEGQKLGDDIGARLELIERLVGQIETQSAPRLESYRQKLFDRMQKALDGKDIDQNRILLEAAVYADKSAVEEETVRLRSHIAQCRDILNQNEPVGRKLDFLIQEFNREANTIGSKANDLDITALVVDLKAEIEKIREQVQNIE